MRQRAAYDLDRAQQVDGDFVDDLLVGELLGRAEQAVARVVDDDVDRSEGAEGRVDDLPDPSGVREVQAGGPEAVAVLLGESANRVEVADRARDPVAAPESLALPMSQTNV